MRPSLYIGLMSGTSMDGIDGVVVDLSRSAHCTVLSHVHRRFDPALRTSLFQLNQSGADELHRAALAGNALANAYAQVVDALLTALELPAAAVAAIGAHGQTVRHRPGEFDSTGYTCQLFNGALMAERTAIDVVCDFRSRDVAAGGQGAPLVPAFHRAMFAQPGRDVAVLNLGGIANVTLLHADGRTSGHDCGPANVLLDTWCEQHTGSAFDAEEIWAAQGNPSAALLADMLQERFLQRIPPKSTGRDLFNTNWLESRLKAASIRTGRIRPVDVQATLALFTARSVAGDLTRWMPQLEQLLVCGGGACNIELMRLLVTELPRVQVRAIQTVHAIDPMHVEAAAFAWLAQAHVDRLPANCTDVTGAAGPRVLGAMYPA